MAGCLQGGGGAEDPHPVSAPKWQVGDKWVYARTGSATDGLIYEREVTGMFMHGSNLVYELQSGLRNHPLQDFHLYRTDDLRFVGSDLRDGSQLMKRVVAEDPIVFHYVFPLEPGRTVETEGVLQQRVTGHDQKDPVTVAATVDVPRDYTLGERVYTVYPYEIEILFQSTPFDEPVVLTGLWSHEVGQSVVTELTEGGETVRHELLYFERQEPKRGPPAYRLVPPLESVGLERGFDARLTDEGWQRFLFHVEDPVRVGVKVATGTNAPPGQERLDIVSLRPLGYSSAGIVDQLPDLATGGLFLHVTATDGDEESVHHHAAEGQGNDMVLLQPGQVYELILSSNAGDVTVRVEHGDEVQAMSPVERGEVEVLSEIHQEVTMLTDPGPQSLSDSLEVRLDNPSGERIEGIVYTINHGGSGESLGELEGQREVELTIDGWAWRDDEALYAYYFGYVPRDGFYLRTAYEYSATLALQGAVEYEMGVLLLKLLPP